jgi:Flp pilus assembly protein TadG
MSSSKTYVAKTLFKCDSGVTTLEFAMISPVLIMFIMGIIEFSLIMFTFAVMESATGNTARLGKTGYIAPGTSRQQQLIDNVANRTAGLLDPARITVETKTYSSFSNVDDPEPYIDANHNGTYNLGESYTDINGNGQWDPDMARSGAGNANDIVVYKVSYPWPVMTPVISSLIGSIFTISARTVVKNEPY